MDDRFLWNRGGKSRGGETRRTEHAWNLVNTFDFTISPRGNERYCTIHVSLRDNISVIGQSWPIDHRIIGSRVKFGLVSGSCQVAACLRD